MSNIIIIRTGLPGTCDTVIVDWFDENNVSYTEEIEIVIQDQDKPRTLEIRVNGIDIFALADEAVTCIARLAAAPAEGAADIADGVREKLRAVARTRYGRERANGKS